MREFTVNFNEMFTNGLRPDERLPRNTPYLLSCDNVVCRNTGMEEYFPIEDPFQGNINVSYPYPAIYRGNYLSLLLEENRVGVIDESSLPWTVEYYDTDSYIPSGGVWQVMDLNNSFYLFNGQCIVAKIQDDDRLLVNTQVPANSGINFRGRSVIGGIRPTDIWTNEWDNIFYFWQERNTHLPNYVTEKPDKSYVMWGTIGGGDFPLWLFKPEMLEVGNVNYGTYEDIANKSYLINQLRMNQFGFMPMPFQGDVLTVKTLGKGIMVYGEDAIVYMPHFDGRTVGNEQIPPTFGIQHVANFGMSKRMAVAGNDSNHIFMSDSGDIWTINAELSLNKLGYKEYFYPMLEHDNIVMDYTDDESDFYITDGNDSFILSKGLSRVHQCPTSVFHTGGGLVGMFTNEGSDDVFIKTNTFDMNIRGVKTVVNVNLAYDADDIVEVAIEYKYSSTGTFSRTPFQRVNKEGVAFVRAHGLEFRLVIKCATNDNFTLDYANVRWQADDKRNVRGLGAVQDSA